LPRQERDEILQQYQEGGIKVLCACDILNEGWDCPQVEALFMARPTLSKVIYLQQLGRGTRKAPGKECLTVFDFVDNASRYNQALSMHSVLGERFYRPGGLVLAPGDLKRQEDAAIARGEKPTTVLELGVWAKDLEEIDIFNWREVAPDMLSVAELELELAAAEGTVRRAVERGEIMPDHRVQIGERACHYFHKDRIEEVRLALGLPKVTSDTIKSLFVEFVRDMDMSASYKPVMLLSILDLADQNGRADKAAVIRRFRDFYVERKQAGKPVERANMRMTRVDELADEEVAHVMLGMPFEKFERRRYLKYDRDLAYIRFDPRLWRQFTPADLEELRTICLREIEQYYDRLSRP